MEGKMKKIGKVALKISFVFYLLALVYLLFLGTRAIFWSDISWIEYIKNSSNFVPFKTITTYILAMFDGSMNMYIPIENLFGNFMMFMPMGIYLPYLFKHLNKFSRFTISMSSLLIVIEVVQVVTRLGSFDIDDFILNMLGAWIGYGVWKTKVVQYLLK
jgi:glycopeptide antibiotics resistance protein